MKYLIVTLGLGLLVFTACKKEETLGPGTQLPNEATYNGETSSFGDVYIQDQDRADTSGVFSTTILMFGSDINIINEGDTALGSDLVLGFSLFTSASKYADVGMYTLDADSIVSFAPFVMSFASVTADWNVETGFNDAESLVDGTLEVVDINDNQVHLVFQGTSGDGKSLEGTYQGSFIYQSN